MRDTIRVSLAQMTSADRHDVNVAWLAQAAARAAGDGADLLALPEVAGLMAHDPETLAAQVREAERDPWRMACVEAAARHGIWIATGSSPVKGTHGKMVNHGDLIDGAGRVVASYDKIHLFDVYLDGQAPSGESSRYDAGGQAVLADTPWGSFGLTICYDLRFPHLYRDYARAGATVLMVPAAFTVPTGAAHWEVLLRARAIENGAYVVAPAQVGRHADGRQTWGHAMIVSPWGEVLADLGGADPGIVTVDLPLAAVAAARRQIPSLANERPYAMTRTETMAPA